MEHLRVVASRTECHSDDCDDGASCDSCNSCWRDATGAAPLKKRVSPHTRMHCGHPERCHQNRHAACSSGCERRARLSRLAPHLVGPTTVPEPEAGGFAVPLVVLMMGIDVPFGTCRAAHAGRDHSSARDAFGQSHREASSTEKLFLTSWALCDLFLQLFQRSIEPQGR